MTVIAQKEPTGHGWWVTWRRTPDGILGYDAIETDAFPTGPNPLNWEASQPRTRAVVISFWDWERP